MHDRMKPAGPAPDGAALREAALRHLSRYAATEAGLVRVLERRVGRWARAAEAEGLEVAADVARARAEARAVSAGLVQAGMVDDAAFAAARAARLVRAGRSRRAVAAHLAAKGVPGAQAEAVLPGEELPSALAYAKRRRLGPFRVGEEEDGVRARELGALARAGFGRDVAERALAMEPEEAAAIVLALKRS